MSRLFTVLLLLSMFSVAIADEHNALRVERVIDHDIELSFSNDAGIHPSKSDFKILNYILLSNDLGDRFATVTLKNTSSGNRIFGNKQLMGLFANGKRLSPLEREITFEGKEVLTFTVSFGRSKFPVLQVYTRN